MLKYFLFVIECSLSPQMDLPTTSTYNNNNNSTSMPSNNSSKHPWNNYLHHPYPTFIPIFNSRNSPSIPCPTSTRAPTTREDRGSPTSTRKTSGIQICRPETVRSRTCSNMAFCRIPRLHSRASTARTAPHMIVLVSGEDFCYWNWSIIIIVIIIIIVTIVFVIIIIILLLFLLLIMIV